MSDESPGLKRNMVKRIKSNLLVIDQEIIVA